MIISTGATKVENGTTQVWGELRLTPLVSFAYIVNAGEGFASNGFHLTIPCAAGHYRVLGGQDLLWGMCAKREAEAKKRQEEWNERQGN